MRTQSLKDESGFTLVEMLVVMAIMMVFLVGVGNMIVSGVRSSSASYNLVKMDEAANEALDTMARQIRVSTCLSNTCSANSILFAGDVDGDTAVEAVQFAATGGYLQRGDALYGSSELPMVNWIQGCNQVTFTYWYYNDATGQFNKINMASATDWNAYHLGIKRVDIELKMSGSNLSRTYAGGVALRNQLEEF